MCATGTCNENSGCCEVSFPISNNTCAIGEFDNATRKCVVAGTLVKIDCNFTDAHGIRWYGTYDENTRRCFGGNYPALTTS